MSWPFADIPRGSAGLILADPPWNFDRWSEEFSEKSSGKAPQDHYPTMTVDEIKSLPVVELAAPDCVLVMWTTAPHLQIAMEIIPAWGFTYKTIGFGWMKADVSTLDMFGGPIDADMGMGYWTRSNLEVALLATRGSPSRGDAGVRMGIIEPAREHSRKPDCQYERLERLMGDVPRVELFSRTNRKGWSSWGFDAGKFGTV
jgi:N6-adenosine-specific RNA methylase IME4